MLCSYESCVSYESSFVFNMRKWNYGHCTEYSSKDVLNSGCCRVQCNWQSPLNMVARFHATFIDQLVVSHRHTFQNKFVASCTDEVSGLELPFIGFQLRKTRLWHQMACHWVIKLCTFGELKGWRYCFAPKCDRGGYVYGAVHLSQPYPLCHLIDRGQSGTNSDVDQNEDIPT